MSNFSKLEKDFIRHKVLSVFNEVHKLTILWSSSKVLETRWVLMIRYESPAPTQRIIKGSDIKCPIFTIVKVKEMITLEKVGYLEWVRDTKLKKILK